MRRVVLFALIVCALTAHGDHCPEFSKKRLLVTAITASGCQPHHMRCWYEEPVTFEVRGFGYDLDCRNHRYEWTFSDGTRANGRKVTHNFAYPHEIERVKVVVKERWSSARIITEIQFNVPVP